MGSIRGPCVVHMVVVCCPTPGQICFSGPPARRPGQPGSSVDPGLLKNQSGRPAWRGGAVLAWEVSGNWRLATSVLVLGEAYASSIPTGGVFLDGYARIDLALTWQPRANLTLRFAVDNVLDAAYQEAVGFPGAGIRGRIGASHRF